VIKKAKTFAALAIAVIISGCAHSINIAPSSTAINTVSASEKFNKRIAYFLSESIEKEVTTPGGGGDSVKYKPYRDIEGGLLRVLSNTFSGVVSLSSEGDPRKSEAELTASFLISTSSSSSSVVTYPPTLFGVNIATNIKDSSGATVANFVAVGEGRAEFSEFVSDHGLSGKRAAQDALNKLQTQLIANPALRVSAKAGAIKNVDQQSPANSKEARLTELKRLFDAGLISQQVFNERQKFILND
jgi:hypothetical protein